MIPLLAALRIGRHDRLWIPIPLFLLWLLLLPLCVLALPFFVWACRAQQVPAGRTLAAGWALLRGLRGARVELTQSEVAFALRLI